MNSAATLHQIDPDALRFSGASGAQLEADVLVIGSGAGGATVALTAAECGHSVLVLEEGPHIPADKRPASVTETRRSLWRHAGLTSAYGRPFLPYAEGCCLGGSTEISYGIFQRVSGALLAEWQTRYAIRDFGNLHMAPYYEWAFDIAHAGPNDAALGTSNKILAASGKLMGWDTRRPDCSLPNGKSHTGAMSHLLAALHNKGHRVLAETRVRRIVMNGPRVAYVEAETRSADGRKHKIRVKADKIFVCAGAVQTPALLQKAGFRGAIGQTLRFHPAMSCLALFDKPIDAHNDQPARVAVTEFSPGFQLTEAAFTPAAFGQMIGQDWLQRSVHLAAPRHAMIYNVTVRGEGAGRVFAMPGGLAPLVTYKLGPQDWDNLNLGIAQLGQALLHAGAKVVVPSVAGHEGWYTPHEAANDGWAAHPKNAQVSTMHMLGSCPMGEDALRCGVDSYGRVHGAANLYVADASLIPEASGVPPQATVMALARRNALHALQG